MPAVVIPNAALVRLIWTVGGVPNAVNVLGAQVGGGTVINQALANTLGSAIKSALGSSAFDQSLATTVALANVGVRDVRGANLAEFLDTNAAHAGVTAGDMLPPQTAACVTLRTAMAGKSFRGRVFFFGFPEVTNSAGGVMTSGVSTSAVAFVNAVMAAMTASGLTLAVISRTLAVATPVTSAVMRDLVWDTQRRRTTPGI